MQLHSPPKIHGHVWHISSAALRHTSQLNVWGFYESVCSSHDCVHTCVSCNPSKHRILRQYLCVPLQARQAQEASEIAKRKQKYSKAPKPVERMGGQVTGVSTQLSLAVQSNKDLEQHAIGRLQVGCHLHTADAHGQCRTNDCMQSGMQIRGAEHPGFERCALTT